MPRIEFDGIGVPIPAIALPPSGADGLVPTMLTFLDNADFSIDVYRELGYTHFEAWCVGAAGGRGGDASSQPFYVYEEIWRPVSSDIWAAWLSQFDNSTIYYGWNPSNPSQGGTQQDIQNFNNPGHLLKFRTYRRSLLFPVVEAMGGGGGGGGMHKISGLLADLPDLVPIVVGKAGADAGYGQVVQPGVWTPPYTTDSGYSYANAFITSYLNSYPGAQDSYPVPQPGVAGGHSSFGDLGKASGGEGGGPGKIWTGSAFVVKGEGGDGGVGGSVVPGGGGAGSVTEGVNGEDGIWHPETGIGAGGGGGRGGQPPVTTGDPRFGSYITTTHLATAGGQGSYSFADTSVYGQRQFRQPWTYMKPVRGYSTIAQPGGSGSWPNGTFNYAPTTEANNLVVPGGGGGARPTKNLKVGSHAPGYSPNGAVVVRLTRIT